MIFILQLFHRYLQMCVINSIDIIPFLICDYVILTSADAFLPGNA